MLAIKRYKMKAQTSSSKALPIALITLTSFYLPNFVRGQETKSHTDSATTNKQPRLVVQLGHSEDINDAAISRDDKYVLTGSADGTARLWEADTGRKVRDFGEHSVGLTPEVTAVAFSQESKYVLTGSDSGIVQQWEADTGREVRLFTCSPPGIVRAFSSDGLYVIATSDNTAWLWEVESGKLVQKFTEDTSPIYAAALSADDKYVLTGSQNSIARLWKVETGKAIQVFEGHAAAVWSVAFSADGQRVITMSRDNTERVWEVRTGKEAQRLERRSDLPRAIKLSPDGRTKVNIRGTTAWLVDAETGKEVQRFQGHSSRVLSSAFSADGKYIVTGNDDETARLWEVETGKEVRRFVGHTSTVASAVFSSDGKYVVTGSGDKTARLWETETGKETQRFIVPTSSQGQMDARNDIMKAWDSILSAWANKLQDTSGVQGVAISIDGKYVVTSCGKDGATRLWETATGKEVQELFRKKGYSAAFSSDGKYLATDGGDVCLWDMESRRMVRRFEHVSLGTAFSPDNRYLLGSLLDKASLLEIGTGRQVQTFIGHSGYITSVAYSPDGKYVLTGSWDATARLWEVETGKEIRRFEGHLQVIRSVAFSPDGKYVLTSSEDSTNRLWDVSTGKQLCSLISFRDGNWAVVAPDGRFDASNLEEIKGLHWVMPDEPMRTYPLENLMRDYYEPRLLPRILAGEQFKPVQSIATLNRVQPKVAIAAVKPQPDHRDLATVTVKVSKATGEFRQGDKTVTRATDVYDLRLFRDGQLVAQAPQFNPSTNSATNQAGAAPEQIRKAWREQARVRLEPNGERTIIFSNIKLPRRADTKQVEFEAYAFNEDRVKSQTDRKTFDVPKELLPVKGRAYVLTVGVNAYENQAWNLQFAANDARLAQQTLSDGLKQSGEFAEVINVSLISDAQPAPGAKPATKASFKAALAEIARQARPEDLVLIYHSSHGYADQSGNYYFFTADTGPGIEKAITPELLRHSISSDELSAWLRDVDAGEIALVIDACQSAGTVKGEAGGEFKPGPMGSRGLGQLAYDKGMRILAASQADDFAFETAALEHGLLTYALIKDGIEGRKADVNRDRQITLSEALAYSLARVPKLYEAMRRGELAKLFEPEGHRGPQVVGAAASLKRKNGFQQPSLFDFAKSRREVVLVR